MSDCHASGYDDGDTGAGVQRTPHNKHIPLLVDVRNTFLSPKVQRRMRHTSKIQDALSHRPPADRVLQDISEFASIRLKFSKSLQMMRNISTDEN